MDQQRIDEEHQEHGATQKTYLAIAGVLAVFTYLEVFATQHMNHGPLLIVTLIVLAFIKAGLVVAFYMHLKFDSRMYSGIVGLALLLIAYFLGILVWGS